MILNRSVAVYVPSNSQGHKFDNRPTVRKVSKELARLFGGSTSYQARGSWLNDKGRLINEDITIVKSYCNQALFAKYKKQVIRLGNSLKHDLNQDAISLEFNNTLRII